ncbi:MAG TPA: hypothetical protein VJV41_15665 [Mycobacterium sp.]|nr:hypothetical protein [Mycobacterium sp.]HKP42402.1 hypothetical protein [Mycobacterium sp.]
MTEAMPDLVARLLDTVGSVSAPADRFAQSQTVLFLGRHVGNPVALEGDDTVRPWLGVVDSRTSTVGVCCPT